MTAQPTAPTDDAQHAALAALRTSYYFSGDMAAATRMHAGADFALTLLHEMASEVARARSAHADAVLAAQRSLAYALDDVLRGSTGSSTILGTHGGAVDVTGALYATRRQAFEAAAAHHAASVYDAAHALHRQRADALALDADTWTLEDIMRREG